MVIDNHNLRDKVQFLAVVPYSVRCGLNDNIVRHMPEVGAVYEYSDLSRALAGNLGAALNAHMHLRATALTVRGDNE
jgi:hypothetical protein